MTCSALPRRQLWRQHIMNADRDVSCALMQLNYLTTSLVLTSAQCAGHPNARHGVPRVTSAQESRWSVPAYTRKQCPRGVWGRNPRQTGADGLFIAYVPQSRFFKDARSHCALNYLAPLDQACMLLFKAVLHPLWHFAWLFITNNFDWRFNYAHIKKSPFIHIRPKLGISNFLQWFCKQRG